MGLTSQRLTSWRGATSVPITTCTLTASADSHVEQDSSGSNFGSAGLLDVQSHQTTVLVLTTNRNRRSFVKFDVSSCGIASNAEVKSATLRVFLAAAPNQSRTWNIGRVTASWTEGGVTWSNQPAATGSTSVTTGTTSNVTLQANVTSDVTAFVTGTANNGWRFMDSAENSSTQRLGQMAARESGTASQRPTLIVNYYP